MLLDALFVRLDPRSAAIAEGTRRICQQFNRRQYVVQYYRLVYIQLEVTLRTCKRHGVVVAKYLDGNHRECLALSRIDLSRHDRGAGFVFGNFELAYSSARTTCI